MYSADQTQRLQKQTAALLNRARSGPLAVKDLEELRDVLRFHEYRYAIMNDPLISDFEYDTLYKELEKDRSRPPLNRWTPHRLHPARSQGPDEGLPYRSAPGAHALPGEFI